jgi:uncharacterized membrane protein
MANTAITSQSSAPAYPPVQVRQVPLSAIWEALRLGVADAKACNTPALAIAVLMPLAGVFLGSVFVVQAFLPFVFPICAGFALLGPLATLWFAAQSRRVERGDESALSVFTEERLVAIQHLSVIAIMLFVVWNVTAGIIYGLTLGSSDELAGAGFFDRVFHTQAGLRLIAAGCGSGAVFAVLSLSVFFISFPLVLDRPVGALEAVSISVRAMVKNPVFVFCWGAVVIFGLFVGALPMLLGVAVVLPVLGHANWHLYRRIVV